MQRQKQRVHIHVQVDISVIHQRTDVIKLHIVVSEQNQLMQHCGILIHQVIILLIMNIVQVQHQQHVDLDVIQIIHGK